MISIALRVAGALLGCSCLAQVPSGPRFEAASVRPSSAPNRFGGTFQGGPESADPGRISFTGMPMIRLLMWAYDIPVGAASPDRRFGPESARIEGPLWIQTQSYDISARLPPGSTRQQAEVMLQNLLADRFRLRSITKCASWQAMN